ncbi:unnamed protein product [Blepharisma stoltei]|uniref:Uncharacterized protein n=1 Tax=Blepharisma stoltei TaxID=1481888 RepID=A0AAU9IHB2_9CILI|nr:unnamed protein product [Blepharisma stoltei]
MLDGVLEFMIEHEIFCLQIFRAFIFFLELMLEFEIAISWLLVFSSWALMISLWLQAQILWSLLLSLQVFWGLFFL